MHRLEDPRYLEDLDAAAVASCVDWSRLDGRRIAVTGATGCIGTFLCDTLMRRNELLGTGIELVALTRNPTSAARRLPYLAPEVLVACDLGDAVPLGGLDASVLVHLASTTHPVAYATRPVSTITTNVLGLVKLFESLDADGGEALMGYASSVEVYGENRGDVEEFDESYLGYLDCNTLRAGYPEAKRVGEALCQAYARERGIASRVFRLPRVYGPTVLPDDSKALSQFLHKALAGEDIVLKSEGTQHYSYLYVADAVVGLLCCLTRGEQGVAYNVCGPDNAITLRELASCLAQLGGSSVIFDLPSETERAGYSTATKALLSWGRIEGLGFSPRYDIRSGLERTFHIMRS